MRLADADTAQPGLTITAASQTGGKGQRGKTWADEPGQSLLMSVITSPDCGLDSQFLFNACVATAIADALQALDEHWDIRIKWPNDIIVNDKKAGGVLIENVLRGNKWVWAIIGLGLNVLQNHFPAELPYATSLKIASGKNYALNDLLNLIRRKILENTVHIGNPAAIMERYNACLFRKGEKQEFYNDDQVVSVTVIQAMPNGQLEVALEDGTITYYTHGTINWRWL